MSQAKRAAARTAAASRTVNKHTKQNARAVGLNEPIESGPHDEVNKTAEEVAHGFPLNDEARRDGLSDNMPF